MIPFNKVYLTGKEIEYVQDCLAGNVLCGDGKYSKKCAELIESKFDSGKVLLTPSGTHALELAALALNLKEGDEVILPTHTFVSTANAFVLRGARPVFVDIREDTMNIDENKIENKITSRTKAIVPVHYAGVGCEMDVIMALAKKYGIAVVEDAAQGVNATYNEKYLGTIGTLGCFSFHDTKNYVCGEGGAILVNDRDLVEKVEITREKGTNRTKFIRGEVDKYTWVDLGSSYLLSDILAAFLYAQLENMGSVRSLRENIYNRYAEELKEIKEIKLPVIPKNVRSNYHIFYFLVRNEAERNSLILYLKNRGIQTNSHYTIPLHLSPMGQEYGYKKGDFPIAENLMSRFIRLPMFAEITAAEQKTICAAIKEFYSHDKFINDSGALN